MIRKAYLSFMLFASAGILMLGCYSLVFPPEVDIKYSTLVKSREGKILKAFLSEDEKWRIKCDPDSIPELFKKSIIYKEDKWFWFHPGINPISAVRAFANNTRKGYRTSGASTITMQVARLLNPGKRTVFNKFKEALFALRLELFCTKKEILALYLDLLPYGSNVEGVMAASYIYYGKEVSLLSDAQIATLTVIPNKPTTLRPGKSNDELFAHRNKWLQRYHTNGIINADRLQDALSEPVEMKRHAMPATALHLATRAFTENHNQHEIITTIDFNVQESAQQIVYNHHLRNQLRHIYNISVLIVDNKQREIISYIGNADFNDGLHHGQVDGVYAVRSPGSALKPLVYGIGIDKGLITPNTVMADVPVNHNGYAPENYNRDYNGEVTVTNALSHSLNIPAVDLLQKTGLPDFISALKSCGFESIGRHEKDLGLSAVLGGCGVTLKELAGLYVALANKGDYSEISYIKNKRQAKTKKILSAESAYMINDILSKHERPDLPNNFENSFSLPPIAWKTGTSYGRRDAWSIGYNDKHTIAVWCGNFDGTGIPELSGADIATPLLFDLFSAVDRSGNRKWNAVPENIDIRYVCSATGKLPGEYCTDRIMDQYIPGLSSQERCTHMQLYAVNKDETKTYCASCKVSSCMEKVYRVLDPEVYAYYISKGIPCDKIPPHNESCSRLQNDAIAVTSPVHNKEYLLEKGMDEKLAMSCSPHPDASTLFWYLNDTLYRKAGVHEDVFFIPAPGLNKISCADDKGRTGSTWIMAKYF